MSFSMSMQWYVIQILNDLILGLTVIWLMPSEPKTLKTANWSGGGLDWWNAELRHLRLACRAAVASVGEAAGGRGTNRLPNFRSFLISIFHF